jgi:hypothetical protein
MSFTIRTHLRELREPTVPRTPPLVSNARKKGGVRGTVGSLILSSICITNECNRGYIASYKRP